MPIRKCANMPIFAALHAIGTWSYCPQDKKLLTPNEAIAIGGRAKSTMTTTRRG